MSRAVARQGTLGPAPSSSSSSPDQDPTATGALLTTRPVASRPSPVRRIIDAIGVALLPTVAALLSLETRLRHSRRRRHRPSRPPPPRPFVTGHLSGSQGEIKGGPLRVLDPRTAFRVPGDTDRHVYFAARTSGKHQLPARGGDQPREHHQHFEYVAKTSALSAYWELTLSTSRRAATRRSGDDRRVPRWRACL